LLGATGVIARDLADPPIIPQVVDPPPITGPPDPPPTTPAAVPELSTWTMMVLGLAGLALASRNRRALAFLGSRA
ncbi:MAG TPA: hypothetical protein VLI91_07050, partial [Roseiarcus sp.]|nr:hypothetical protein [Roseiarcus sp.]